MNKKIKSPNALKKIIFNLKRNNKKIVFTNGCFDILHYGHIKSLGTAKKLGDCLIVGLNSDKSIRKIKGKNRPINKQKERLHILSSLEYVDYVSIFDETTPLNLIKIIKPDILVKGGDWRDKEIVGKEVVESYGGKVVILPHIKNYSTTSLIRRIVKNFKKARF